MTNDTNCNIDRIYSAWRKRQGRTAGLTLALACTLLPTVAFAQNNSTDPDPDVEAGSYISLNLDQDIVAVGDSITGTSSIYEGDSDVDSDDPITAASDSGSSSTADGTVSFSIPTSTYGDITVTGSSSDASSVKKTAHAVSVNAVLTPVDPFTGRSMTTYGVGENVDLSVTTSPAGYETKIGTLQWTASGDGVAYDYGGGTGLFNAGDVAGSASIVLSVIDGALKGKSYAKSRTIVTPSGVVFVRHGTDLYHVHNTASAGFLSDWYLTPTNVSFEFIQEQEENGPIGVGTGYLKSKNGEVHHGGGWRSVGSGDIKKGCQILAVDHIRSGHYAGPFTQKGKFYWDIPRDYKVGDSGATHQYLAPGPHHEENTDTAGGMTISKGGISVPTKYADPDSPTNSSF